MRQMMRRLAAVFFCIISLSLAFAAPQFPSLSGRIVDQTGLLSPTTQRLLAQQLDAFESSSGNQVVVAIIDDLQGLAIEDYGYQLGRTWGIGQKDQDNGVVFLVAPKARQVRIEVGYGLEGTLTDVLAHDIIQRHVLPHFKQQQMEKGVVAGTRAIIGVLGGKSGSEYQSTSSQPQNESLPWWAIFFLPLVYWGRSGRFSGGGGSFGGGGASGSW